MQQEGTFYLQLPMPEREALQQVHQFLEYFSAEDIQRHCHELFSCALGSEDADTWTHSDRSNMFLFYNELNKLGKALPLIDKIFEYDMV